MGVSAGGPDGEMVTYVWSPPVGGEPLVGDTRRVTVPRAWVVARAGAAPQLPPEAAAPFIEAVRTSAVPFAALVGEVGRLQGEHPHTVRRANAPGADPTKFPAWAVMPQPYAYVEAWEPEPQPWPVFVFLLDGVVAEFYPEQFKG